MASCTSSTPTNAFVPFCGGVQALRQRWPPCHGKSTLPFGNCTERQVAWWNRAKTVSLRLAQAAHSMPVRSVEQFRREKCQRCGPLSLEANFTWEPSRPRVLRVPKSASSFALTMIAIGCNESNRDPRFFFEHQAPPSDACRGHIGIATLREPCERFVSIFHHAQSTYAPGTSLCRYYPSPCRSHWVHLARNVSEFAQLTANRWASIMGTPSISLTETRPIPPAVGIDRGLFNVIKHGVVFAPQALYIGNFSVVLCVNSNLTTQLRKLRHDLRCRGKSPLDEMDTPAAINVHQPVQEQLSASDSDTSSTKYILSDDACAAVRHLYAADWMMWQRLCT